MSSLKKVIEWIYVMDGLSRSDKGGPWKYVSGNQQRDTRLFLYIFFKMKSAVHIKNINDLYQYAIICYTHMLRQTSVSEQKVSTEKLLQTCQGLLLARAKYTISQFENVSKKVSKEISRTITPTKGEMMKFIELNLRTNGLGNIGIKRTSAAKAA